MNEKVGETCFPCIQTSACGILNERGPLGKMPLDNEGPSLDWDCNCILTLSESESCLDSKGKLTEVGVNEMVGKALKFIVVNDWLAEQRSEVEKNGDLDEDSDGFPLGFIPCIETPVSPDADTLMH